MAAIPLIRRKRVLAAKVETVVGTAESPGASEATFNVFDLKAQPVIETVTRDGQGASFAKLPSVTSARMGKFTFSTELIGGASAPLWSSVLLPGAGMVLTSLVAAFESKSPEASAALTKTLTLRCYIDGVYKQIHGAMGNLVIRGVSGQRVMLDWEFTGIWGTVTNATILAPTYLTTAPLKLVSSALTIGSFLPKIDSFELNLGNTIAMREDPSTASGYHSALITGRQPVGKMSAESTITGSHTSSVWDVYADWQAHTERALSMALGSTGNAVAFAAPKFQITNVQEGDRNGLQVDEIDFQLNRSASAGDDELTLTFS